MAYTLQEDRTPLHHASQAGKEAVVAALLEAKADVNSTDKVRRLATGEYGCVWSYMGVSPARAGGACAIPPSSPPVRSSDGPVMVAVRLYNFGSEVLLSD